MVSIPAFEGIQGYNDILMNGLKRFIKSFFLCKIIYQSLHSELLLHFVDGFGKTVCKTKKQEIIEIGDKAFVQKWQWMHRS